VFLIPLATLIVALVALAIAAVAIPRRWVTLGTAGISGVVVLLGLAALLTDGHAASLALPIGPPGGALHLALDPLGTAFLLLVFVAAIPCAIFANAEQDLALAGMPGLLAAIGLTFLAGDAFTLALGLAGVGVSGRVLLSSQQDADQAGHTDTATSYLLLAVFAAVCLIAALALASPPSLAWLDCDYAAIRAMPPEGSRAGAALVLTLVGAAGLAGLAPLHVWVPRFGSASALLAGVGATIGPYLLFRVLLDLSGNSQPLWWGVPLLIFGAASAVLGTLRAGFETSLESSVAIASLHHLGFSVMGLGAALLARGADLPQVASLALDASWLLLVTHTLCRTLLLLCAAAARLGAGTRRLDRLGGLIHRMPVTGMCFFVGLLGAAMLPPGLGFAGFWLLVQSLLGVYRIGGFGLQLLIAFAVLLAGLSLGLAAIAAVRLAGVAFLGRPRTPRTAVAEEIPQALRFCLTGLAALSGLLAVLPGLAIVPAAPGLAQLANGSALGIQLVLKPAAGASGYAPVSIAVLMAVAGYATLWLWRWRGSTRRREPAWSGGFSPPPPWLPFGDPATQIGAVSFAEPIRRILGPCLALRGATDRLRTSLVRLHADLRSAAGMASRPGVRGSVAATLAVLVLAVAVWLVAS
jgi:hydrogenase-4 component B